MDDCDWTRLRYAVTDAPAVLRANADRIRGRLPLLDPEDAEVLTQALHMIEQALLDMEGTRLK